MKLKSRKKIASKAKTAKLKAAGKKSTQERSPFAAPQNDGASSGELDTILSEVSVNSEKRHWENWVQASCPYCGENFEVHVQSEEDGQTVYQDCQVCCKPISIFIQIDEDEDVHVSVARS